MTLDPIDGYPVFTFTHPHEFRRKINAPRSETASSAYLHVIARGLRPHLELEAIVEYLLSRPGVSGRWTKDAMMELVSSTLA